MKKIVFIAACSLIVLGACNKDKKFNKSLDGTWLTTSINGVPVTMADSPLQYTFSKSSKVGGTVNITYFDDYKVDAEYSGTYKISDEGKTITIDAQGINGFSSEPDIHLVDAISNKTDKKFTAYETYEDQSGYVGTDVFVFEKQ
jgi:hypothetical protein